jgi:phosphoribosyl-AMP cyclohydrolase
MLLSQIDSLSWDANGLIPAIVQEVGSDAVLMMAYVSRESLARSLEIGETVFYSRSRKTLWHKGETSGNVQRIREILVDCDGDTLLFRVEAAGAACHTGEMTCFFRTLENYDGQQ